MSKSRKDDRPFTGTEVGALIESFRGDISVIGERVGTLCEDTAILKQDVSEIKTRLVTVEDVIRISIPEIYSRLSRLEARAA